MDIKPIETEYNGYRFRSRLEARWAVFFDSAGIKYQYEPEGYEINGKRYLPDFYLPDLDAHAEVKANVASAEEDIKRCEEMIVWGGPIKRIIFLSDIPKAKPINGYGLWHFPSIYYDSGRLEVSSGWWYFAGSGYEVIKVIGNIATRAGYRMPQLHPFGVWKFDISAKWEKEINPKYRGDFHPDAIQFNRLWNKPVFDALDCARKARFEHGEKPKVRY